MQCATASLVRIIVRVPSLFWMIRGTDSEANVLLAFSLALHHDNAIEHHRELSHRYEGRLWSSERHHDSCGRLIYDNQTAEPRIPGEAGVACPTASLTVLG